MQLCVTWVAATATSSPGKLWFFVLRYPNNPDGEFYPPQYPDAKYHVYDMVYYWPHIVNITQASSTHHLSIVWCRDMT